VVSALELKFLNRFSYIEVVMPYEMMVSLHVLDDEAYSSYREAMRPILERFGGGFRFDFRVGETLVNAADHEINRVFAIYFADEASKDAFFGDPEYLAVKRRFFEHAVDGTTLIGAYPRV
jgi:uncharacterized protein (DUF1330 family)